MVVGSVIEDAFFGKIKAINIPENVLKYFIKKVIDKHPNSSILLRNLSDLIVLVAWTGSEKLNRFILNNYLLKKLHEYMNKNYKIIM